MKTFPPSQRINTPVSALVGADDALAAINTNEVADSCVCMVGGAFNALYQLRKESTAAQSLPAIVAPAQGGPGRWYRLGSGPSTPASSSVAVPAVPPNSTVTVTAAIPNKVAQADLVEVNIESTLSTSLGLVGVFAAPGANVDLRFGNFTGATVAGATVLLRSSVIPG